MEIICIVYFEKEVQLIVELFHSILKLNIPHEYLFDTPLLKADFIAMLHCMAMSMSALKIVEHLQHRLNVI